MIVKMKFLSITGPRADIDRMTNRYLSKYEMQLENALTELKTVDNLMPFLEMNPYRDPLAKVTQFLGYMKDMTADPSFDQSEDEILEMIRSINHDYMDLQQQKEELKRKRENIQTRMKVLEPFTSLDFDLHEIMQYKYIRTRFGKINVDYYHRLEKALLEDIDALFLEGSREPLTNKIKKKTEKMEQSKAMFVTQAFFELFETLLSYFSNTLSFIRIGAFAVSHASIMEVVLMLAGAESGHINWVVIVLGNLFVCGFEGLIVEIQVLRLVYYEMFSRFYKGSGREFKPYTGTAKN